ncbi:MAG TPA: MarR family transcriptional regulator [Cellulomonas sp.]
MKESTTSSDGGTRVGEVQEALIRLVRATESMRARQAAKAGIGVTEMRALARIVERGHETPKELAASLELSTGATTALIDRMESLGVIVRQPNHQDRRSLTLLPTAHGETLMETIREAFVEPMDAALGTTGDAALQRIASTLAAVADHFDQAG